MARAGEGGIDAADRHPRLVGIAEHRAGRRDVLFAETVPTHRAAGLAGAAAQRSLLERTADELAVRHEQVEARDDRQLHPARKRRVVLDLAGNQQLLHQAALAVADQHERTAVVAGRNIVAPGCEDVAIGEGERLVDFRARSEGGDRRNRHLAIDWNERPAHRGEARELDLGDPLFLDVRPHVGIHARIGRDRRIEIEAVEGRVLGDRGGLRPLHNPLDQARSSAAGSRRHRCGREGTARMRPWNNRAWRCARRAGRLAGAAMTRASAGSTVRGALFRQTPESNNCAWPPAGGLSPRWL